MESLVFVFGSNLAGIHGAGAARYAFEKRGAVYGIGEGLQGLGAFKSYAIPTKDYQIQTLPLDTIKKHVDRFIEVAKQHPEMKFQVSCIGCGLAGYEHQDIAPMFKGAPDNCYFDTKWSKHLPNKNYWGSF